VWVVCIPTLSLYGLIQPLWLDGGFSLVDKDYISHIVLSANLMFALLIRLASLASSL
jgi:hypothetical protein